MQRKLGLPIAFYYLGSEIYIKQFKEKWFCMGVVVSAFLNDPYT